MVIHYPYDPDRHSIFNARADAFERIIHPCIAPLLHRGVTARGVPFYTQPTNILRSMELQMVLRTDPGRLSLSDLVQVLVHVSDALRCIHQAGFLHLQLTPWSIRLTRDRQVFLMGQLWQSPPVWIAERRDSWLMNQPNIYYGSPEQLESHFAAERNEAFPTGSVDARADVYALGGVLHSILHAPVADSTTDRNVQARIAENASPPSAQALQDEGLAMRLKSSYLKALEPDQANRQPTAAAFGRELRQALW